MRLVMHVSLCAAFASAGCSPSVPQQVTFDPWAPVVSVSQQSEDLRQQASANRSSATAPAPTWVDGYYRKDGTYVRGHLRQKR